MTRVVLDANVLVSAVVSPTGAPARILTAWRAEAFDLLLSSAILDEVGRALRYPKIAMRHQWSESQLRDFLMGLAAFAIPTPGHLTLDVITDDPDDNRYLECAVEGEADYIISGDRHLLALRTYEGIPILTPRAFLTAVDIQPSS